VNNFFKLVSCALVGVTLGGVAAQRLALGEQLLAEEAFKA